MSEPRPEPWPHGVEHTTALDLMLARACCDVARGEGAQPFYAHAGDTTDLVYGGGCPRCIEMLKEIVCVRRLAEETTA